MRKIIYFFCIAVFIFGCSIKKEHSNDYKCSIVTDIFVNTTNALVLTDNVLFFREPTMNSVTVNLLQKNDLVEVIASENTATEIWYQVRLEDVVGWVKAENLVFSVLDGVPPEYNDLLITTKAKSISYSVIKQINDAYTIINCYGGECNLFYDKYKKDLLPEFNRFIQDRIVLKEGYEQLQKKYDITECNTETYARKIYVFLDRENPDEFIESEFGTPNSCEITTQNNRYEPVHIDSIVRYKYDGLEILLWRNEDRTKSIVWAISVKGNRYPTFFGIKVGSSRQYVESVLGKGHSSKEHNIYDMAGPSGMGPVFEISFDKNDKVAEITWSQSAD